MFNNSFFNDTPICLYLRLYMHANRSVYLPFCFNCSLPPHVLFRIKNLPNTSRKKSIKHLKKLNTVKPKPKLQRVTHFSCYSVCQTGKPLYRPPSSTVTTKMFPIHWNFNWVKILYKQYEIHIKTFLELFKPA